MQSIGKEPLPVPAVNNMCPTVAITVLNRKGYNIAVPRANCMFGQFLSNIEVALTSTPLRVNLYENETLGAAKLKITSKQKDGVLLLRNKSNIFHFIAFIVVNNEVRFYDAEGNDLNVYKLKNNTSVTDFNNDFHTLFPEYEINKILLIEQPVVGKGGKKRTRKTMKRYRRRRVLRLPPTA